MAIGIEAALAAKKEYLDKRTTRSLTFQLKEGNGYETAPKAEKLINVLAKALFEQRFLQAIGISVEEHDKITLKEALVEAIVSTCHRHFRQVDGPGTQYEDAGQSPTREWVVKYIDDYERGIDSYFEKHEKRSIVRTAVR